MRKNLLNSLVLRRGQLWIILIGSLLLWTSTGTVSYYAASYEHPLVSSSCSYLYNIDYQQFYSTLQMINGAPPETWDNSYVLRRASYYLLGYPIFYTFGFELGGVLFNLFLTAMAAWLYMSWVQTHHSSKLALLSGGLFLSYPGVAYFFGSPFPYAAIAPWCVVSALALKQLEKSPSDNLALLVIALGALFHDTLVILFGMSAGIILVHRGAWRRLPWLGLLCALSILAPMFIVRFLKGGSSLIDENSAYYGRIISSLLHAPWDSRWISQFIEVPETLLSYWLFAGFVFLPIASIIWMLLLNRARRIPLMTISESSILIACLMLAILLNLTPLYNTRFSMRGPAYARLYMPVLAFFLMFVPRTFPVLYACGGKIRKFSTVVLIVVIAGNISVSLGGYIMPRMAGGIYNGFYGHSSAETLELNLSRYGLSFLGSSGCPWRPEPPKFPHENNLEVSR